MIDKSENLAICEKKYVHRSVLMTFANDSKCVLGDYL